VKEISERRLTELADAAFFAAANKVINRAIESGTPVILSENGKVKKVDPRKIRLPRVKTKKLRSKN
jgi:hypothetical protein